MNKLDLIETLKTEAGITKTGEQVKVKPKKLPFFKCGKELKERVDSNLE